jgi:hypothetical protein
MAILNYFWLFQVTFYYFNLFHIKLMLVFFLPILCFFGYCKLFQFKLFVAIINYFWLLKVISLDVIIGKSRLL